MSSSVVRRPKLGKSPIQPLDRHPSELSVTDGSVYINAGIDSTCSKKHGRTIYKLTNGIMVPSYQAQAIKRTLSGSADEFSSELSNDSSSDDQFDSRISRHCSHCGK